MRTAIQLLLVLLALRAGAASYYVDATGGSDAANGLTTGTAWKSFANATNIATSPIVANDTIYLKRGETWTGCFTHPTNYTTLDAYGSGAPPVINGGGTAAACVIASMAGTVTRNLVLTNGAETLWTSSAWTNTIENCTVMKATFDCVSVGATSYTICRSNFISGSGDDGFTLHATSRGLVEWCTFTNCASAINNSGTDMQLTVNDCTFINNVSFDVGPLDNCVSVFNRCRWRGRIGGGGSLTFYGGGGDHHTTFNYCVFDATEFSGSLSQPEWGGSTNCYLNNCVFTGVDSGRFIIYAGPAYATNTIFKGWWKLGEIYAPGTFIADHCIFNGIANSNATTVTSCIAGDPMFVSSSDFTLQSSSPAINAGTPIGLTLDLNGIDVGNPPEVGAYEFYPANRPILRLTRRSLF